MTLGAFGLAFGANLLLGNALPATLDVFAPDFGALPALRDGFAAGFFAASFFFAAGLPAFALAPFFLAAGRAAGFLADFALLEAERAPFLGLAFFGTGRALALARFFAAGLRDLGLAGDLRVGFAGFLAMVILASGVPYATQMGATGKTSNYIIRLAMTDGFPRPPWHPARARNGRLGPSP